MAPNESLALALGEDRPVPLTEDNRDFYGQTAEFYDECAQCYDELYPDHVKASRQAAEIVAPIFHKAGVRRVLDASCGVGHDIESFCAHGFQVDGVDISDAMLQQARLRLDSIGLSTPRLYKGDVRRLTDIFPEGSYDALIFRGNTLSNLHHEDYPNAFKEMAAILRRGGLLYVDFRDGESHFRDRRRFEFRGFCFSPKRLSMAWYRFEHSDSIAKPFQVTASVASLSFGSRLFPKCQRIRIAIRSHYVPKWGVIEAMSGAGLSVVRELEVHSLSYLRTYIARQNDSGGMSGI